MSVSDKLVPQKSQLSTNVQTNYYSSTAQISRQISLGTEAGQVTSNETSLQINRHTMVFYYASKSALYICMKTHNNQT